MGEGVEEALPVAPKSLSCWSQLLLMLAFHPNFSPENYHLGGQKCQISVMEHSRLQFFTCKIRKFT